MSEAMARVRRLLGSDGAALAALSTDLRALQLRVDELQRHVHTLAAGQDEQRARQVEEFDAIRSAVAGVADDLGTRIAALHHRSSGAPAS